MIFGGKETGIVLLSNKLPKNSKKDGIKLYYMGLKVVVMETKNSDSLWMDMLGNL